MMAQSRDDSHFVEIVDRLERHISERPATGSIGPETVEALDVLNHALVFASHPRALELWREALWNGRLLNGARQAIVVMFEYLAEATARGESEEVSRICDCLQVFVEPTLEDQHP